LLVSFNGSIPRRSQTYKSAPIYFLAIAYPQDQDHQSIIFDAGNDSDVTQSVFPEVTKLRAFQGLTNAAGIFEALQSGS
jgi:hypothetical protein